MDVNENFEIALGGNPGHICKPGSWDKETGGAADPEAKSIVRLHKSFALAALGEGGLKSFDLSSGNTASLVSSIPRPVVPEGEPEWDWVTNGVSVSANGWVYLANGAGGLDVARIDDLGNLTWMGNAFMWASANYVESNSTNVFVARGTLGLKICKGTENQK